MTNKEKTYFYDYLAVYANNMLNDRGHFDFRDAQVVSFIQANDFCVTSLSDKQIRNARRHANSILMNYENKDKAHDILRHIRNSIAHALISEHTRDRKSIYRVQDKTKYGNLSFFMEIRKDLLDSLIHTLYSTKH